MFSNNKNVCKWRVSKAIFDVNSNILTFVRFWMSCFSSFVYECGTFITKIRIIELKSAIFSFVGTNSKFQFYRFLGDIIRIEFWFPNVYWYRAMFLHLSLKGNSPQLSHEGKFANRERDANKKNVVLEEWMNYY